MSCDIGVYGLSVMGSNLALNIASKGFNVAVSNRSPERVRIKDRIGRRCKNVKQEPKKRIWEIRSLDLGL